MGRGDPQSGGNVIQGRHTGVTPLWIGDLDNFGINGEDGGGNTHWVSKADHGKSGAAEGRWDMGDSRDGSSTGSGGSPVENDLHLNISGGSGKLGGSAAEF